MRLPAVFVVLLLIFLGPAASGCGNSFRLLRDSVTRVELSEANFSIVRQNVTASVSIVYFLCIIPFETKPTTRLMADLNAKARLKRNEVMVNFREDYDIRSVALFCTIEQTISADVVRFESSEGEVEGDEQEANEMQ